MFFCQCARSLNLSCDSDLSVCNRDQQLMTMTYNILSTKYYRDLSFPKETVKTSKDVLKDYLIKSNDV